MVEHLGPDVRRGQPVADHHVKCVSGELCHELIEMILAARHLQIKQVVIVQPIHVSEIVKLY